MQTLHTDIGFHSASQNILNIGKPSGEILNNIRHRP